jgi:hypothetical protein
MPGQTTYTTMPNNDARRQEMPGEVVTGSDSNEKAPSFDEALLVHRTGLEPSSSTSF